MSLLVTALRHPALVAAGSSAHDGGVSSFVTRSAGVSLQDLMGLPIAERQALTHELAAGMFGALNVLHQTVSHSHRQFRML